MQYIKDVDEKFQVYCSKCGMVHEVPKSQINKTTISPYLQCRCGNTGKILSGYKKDEDSSGSIIPYIFLTLGTGLTIGLFTVSNAVGWFGLVISVMAVIGSFIVVYGSDDTAKEQGKLFDKFNVHKANLKNANLSVIAHDYKTALIVDEEGNNINVVYSGFDKSKVYSFKEILSVEVIEDGNSVISTSRSSQVAGALVGGVLAGGAGMIVGGLSGKKTQANRVNRIDLKIMLMDTEYPVHIINFMNDFNFSTQTVNKEGESKNSQKYKNAKEESTYWHGVVSVLIKRADEERVEEKNINKSKSNVDSIDKLTTLISMHKEGYLSKEEFEAEKKKLIG